MTARAILVGAPGAGKTTIGAALAAYLGLPLRDTDLDIEFITGKTIADIFVEDGEAHFRALEEADVADALAQHEGIVSLGGGAVLSAATRQTLVAGSAPVIWLEVGLTAGLERVGLARARPVLAINPRARLSQLLTERAPLYEEVSDHKVLTDGRQPSEIIEEILALLPPVTS